MLEAIRVSRKLFNAFNYYEKAGKFGEKWEIEMKIFDFINEKMILNRA